MSDYRKPTVEEKVTVADGMTVGLPIGTKAWVCYEDTCYGRVLKIATVIEKEGFGRVFDNGYENAICGIEWYAIAEQLKEQTDAD